MPTIEQEVWLLSHAIVKLTDVVSQMHVATDQRKHLGDILGNVAETAQGIHDRLTHTIQPHSTTKPSSTETSS